MPPRFGTPLPGPSLADMVEEEREKKKAREAERAKASSPGGPGTGLLVRPAHPMMIRPTAQMVSSYVAGGTIDNDLMKTGSSMTTRPGTSMRAPTRSIGRHRC